MLNIKIGIIIRRKSIIVDARVSYKLDSFLRKHIFTPASPLPSLPLSLGTGPRWLTFTWWGCYGLCFGHKPTELAHSLYSVLVSISAFMALSTIFHSIHSPDNSPQSHCSSGIISALLVLSTIYLFMKVSFSPDIILCG